MRPSPLSGGEIPRPAESLSPGGDVAHSVQMQLSAPADVKAAHNFFQPTGAEVHLPPVPGITGAPETASAQFASKFSESAIATAAQMAGKFGEGAAMSAAQNAGAQAISPMIQMIMRMPGHLGLMSSFFEALGQFFMGQDILMALDPTQLLAQHAGSVLHSIGAAAGENLVHLTSLPTNLAANHFGIGDFGGGTNLLNTSAFKPDLTSSPTMNLSEGDAGHHAMNVSGGVDPSKMQFEQAHDLAQNAHEVREPFPGTERPNYLLSDSAGTATFRPTFSSQGTTPVNPQTTAAAPAQGASHSGLERGDHFAGSKHHQLLEKPHVAQSPAESGTESSGSTDYTVQRGDNLWDIARKQLGDATRWPEIYQLNQDILANHPNLIHVGDQLHLPGNNEIASGDYVVKPGDNLWDISRHNLGGGQHWSELYQANEGVIGSNPNLIHPGQHLTLGTSSHEVIAAAHPVHVQSVAPHSVAMETTQSAPEYPAQPLETSAPAHHPLQMASSRPYVTDATTHGYTPTENIPTDEVSPVPQQQILQQQIPQQQIMQQQIPQNIPRGVPVQMSQQPQLPLLRHDSVPQNMFEPAVQQSNFGIALSQMQLQPNETLPPVPAEPPALMRPEPILQMQNNR